MKIFENIQVGRMSLVNRIVYPALVDLLAREDGFTTPELVERVLRIAGGGVGLFILQAACVVKQKSGQLLRINDDRYIEGLKKLTDQVHSQTKAKIGIQLIHFLKISKSGYRQMVEDLSHEEINEIAANFGDAALRAEKAGFDCIEVHCAHAYTLASFLSLRNKRRDEYGKTIEGRLRIVEEVTRQIREKVGDRITLGVRINGDEFILGGNTLSQSRVIAKRLAELGYQYISISAGGKFEDGLVEQGMTSPYSGYSGSRTMPKTDMPDGVNVYLAKDIKNAILPYTVPIITAGKIPDPELAESILQAGDADLIGLARPLLCDPEWPVKVKTRKIDEVVYCKYCGLCNVDDANFVPVVCHQWPKGSFQAPDPFLP
jgi:2,4-dienoyl-CoA reductase-like NADH-dependent reductase (Old Yellow Enzyme family)